MEKRDFEGNLEKISPKKIIDKNNQNDFDDFFLILAMIFNDLKGLIFFQKTIEDNYRRPPQDEVSVHVGEYGGLITQTRKLMISLISELLIFLKNNNDVISNPKFLLLLKKLDKSKNLGSDWAQLINPNKFEKSILSNIARIRSNIAFHYDLSAKELRKGFISSFFSNEHNIIQHENAYFSLGNDMEHTRFYYADAAVGEYMKLLLNKEGGDLVTKTVISINLTLQALLKIYIRSSSNKK